MLNRRLFTQSAAAGLLATTIPNLAFASAPTDKRMIVIILRGALDGMHALIPHNDPYYKPLRPTIAIGKPGTENGCLTLTTDFGLHPALASLKTLFETGEVSFIPAISTQYRRRSHFEAQNMLETGATAPYAAKTGWLNRALGQLGNNDVRLGLALGATVPLIIYGSADIRTWSDSRLPEVSEEFLSRMDKIYADDPLFHKALAQSIEDKSMDMTMMEGRTNVNRFQPAAKAAANLLAQRDGPRIAVMEAGGWDTHYAQERRLSTLFEQLAGAIMELKSGLGTAWKDTAVMIVSEFGRTAAENGSKGTDHGTAGLAILAGGSVKGGQIFGKWPGLSPTALFEERDLRPTSQIEGLFKACLRDHLGLSPRTISDIVFPDMSNIPTMDGLFIT